MKKVRTVFFGTPNFAVTILKSMINSQWLMVKAVVTQPDKPVGRKKILTPSPVKVFAQKHRIPVYGFRDSTSIIQIIKAKKPDLIIVAAFGEILPSPILKIPKYGCLGIHPSLLPKYRGPTPIQAVILKGEKETGVTIFLMDEKIDHGPIISSIKYQVSSIKITAERLSEELAKLGAKLLVETLPKWIEGKIKPQPQNHKKATYTKLLTKKDGFVEWKKIVLATQKGGKEAVKIERMVRAFSPWPGVYTEILREKDNKILRVKILKTRLEKEKLVLDWVQLAGKKPISWQEFVQGYKNFLG